jgi:hypothetical protein
MGLDMYLMEGKRQNDGKIMVDWNSQEIGYWRKANQIHNWFVKTLANGVDECQPIQVTKEDVGILHDLCLKVLNNENLASRLLPTQSGFFFGGTEYDEWYFDDLKQTIEITKRVLREFDFENNILIYEASW